MQNAQLNALRLPSLRSLKFHRPDTADTQSSSPTVAASHQQPWPRAHDTPDDASRVALERYEPPPAYYESAPTLVPAVVNQGDGQVWPQRTSNQDTSYGPERPRTMQRDAEAPFRYVQSAPPSEYSLHASAPREEHAYAAPFYTQSVSRPAIAAQQQQIPTQPVPSAWTPPQPPLTSMPSTESASKEAQGVPHTRSKSPPSPSDIISQIVLHCDALCSFATRYEPVPQTPPDDEMDDMAEIALAVVRLIEDLHRLALGLDEPLPPFSPTVLTDFEVEDGSAHLDLDTEPATPLSAEDVPERGRKRSWDEMATGERDEQADKDMEIIRAKRLAQTQAANPVQGGAASNAKPKYKKRSPGLKRTVPPEKCQACYNAETPEWRRGPYGARTLCNACGIHYSKMRTKREGADSDPDEDMAELRRTVARAPTEPGGRGRRVRRADSLTSRQGPTSQSSVPSPIATSQAPSPPALLSTSPELHAPHPMPHGPYVSEQPTLQGHRPELLFGQTSHLQQVVPDDRYYHDSSAQNAPSSGLAELPYPPPPVVAGGNPLLLGDYSIRSAAAQTIGHPPSDVRSSPHLTSQ